MSPETQAHLNKGREDLAKARLVLERLHYADEAGRLAYLAAFRAAQALICERKGRAAKTHAGVHSQFHLLTKNDGNWADPELRSFSSDGFDLKTVADYDTGPDAVVSHEDAEAAIATAARFIERAAESLAPR